MLSVQWLAYVFDYAVKKGLEKEGWLITDDPLRISAGGADMEIDLGAEKIIAFLTWRKQNRC